MDFKKLKYIKYRTDVIGLMPIDDTMLNDSKVVYYYDFIISGPNCDQVEKVRLCQSLLDLKRYRGYVGEDLYKLIGSHIFKTHDKWSVSYFEWDGLPDFLKDGIRQNSFNKNKDKKLLLLTQTNQLSHV